ncbi:uncharacterized protein LOC113769020 [Coffea eugenioides]|uniref:HTH three-helical bundle domain-containing protein n=1 Tax=Coffea arabica TaxID=13443 RepID=A0A6P6T036_COFAR|nr:uncharacterized protein LOC113696451 [Coffea arabica]XP_027169311.1 uncharacterized protein LOC113769020 [Coffea eugenioides]
MAAAEATKEEAFEFPNAVEREVASALLLLSVAITTPPPSLPLSPPLERSCTGKMKKNKLRFKLSKSQQSHWTCSSSSSSTVTTSENDDRRVKVIAVVSKFHDTMKLKVVRKRRSKNLSISDCQKRSSSRKQAAKVESSASVSASASSCLSSGSSSVISSAGSSGNVIMNRRGGGRGSYLFVTPPAKDLKRKPILGSTHMRRRAEAILKVLSSHGRASEVKIRELLGDSPSTSKALRILLNLEQVKRSGAGGRTDPYVYMIA